MNAWVPQHVRDEIVSFVLGHAALTSLPISRLIEWIGLGRDRFYQWRKRWGRPNRHNAFVPRDFWLEEWERQAIIAYYLEHREEGYRRLTYMMLDADIVAVSPSSTYRVLKKAGLLDERVYVPSKKGDGFVQPLKPHEHWHIDIAYLTMDGAFCFFCGVIDGCSRTIIHWEIRECMKEKDIEIILQRAREKFPHARPRIISDNGPQFIARDFKRFINEAEMTHVRTSPGYPQSNGKIERFHQSLKGECIRLRTPVDMADAIKVVGDYIEHYNNVRLHSAIGYIAPVDKLEGRATKIMAERRLKLGLARDRRKGRYDCQKAQVSVVA